MKNFQCFKSLLGLMCWNKRLCLLRGGGTVGFAEGKEVRQLDRSPELRKAGGQYDVQHDTNPLPQSLPRGREVKRLSSRFTLHSSLKKRAAFTLAEVLITLGIIGVVAAMTIPSVVHNTYNRQLEAAFKKNASAIAQAFALYQADNGVMLHADQIDSAQLKKLIIKYFDVLHDCDKAWGSKDCVFNGSTVEARNVLYKTFNGKSDVNNLNYFDDGQFVLKDGSLIMIENAGKNGNNKVYVSVDVNGYNKSPNKLGHDVFTFQLMNDGRLLPMGADGTDWQNESNYCSKAASHNLNGLGCTSRALYEKDYFKNLP